MKVYTIAALLATFATSVAARPADATGPKTLALAGWGYATFYDDDACTQNGGEAVSIGNDGCLAESGRNSIYIQPGGNMGFQNASLVWSPDGACSCQNNCATVNYNDGNDYCWNLEGAPGAQSFRFITQGCSGNNC